jgi:hypothetical protein
MTLPTLAVAQGALNLFPNLLLGFEWPIPLLPPLLLSECRVAGVPYLHDLDLTVLLVPWQDLKLCML